MSCKIHRVRYYNPKPKSINAISFNKITKALAVSREDASIEIWDLSYAPFLVKFIPGIKDGSIEALCWVNDRLFSTGLGGSLVEWDLNKLSSKKTVLLTGYAAWCLDVNPAATLVAVGTEQGYVNIFSVEDNDIVYRKLFDKQEGRIICCKFNKLGNILVTGSANTIRVWDVETGQAVSRMSTKRRGKETIVWSLGVLSDNTIISGETGGRLAFWDATTGDQIETFITHKADILSITVSEDEESMYCSGVDPVIVNFVKVPTSKASKSGCLWAKTVQRHIHEHDVRCLTLNGDTLVSAGIDGYLTFSSYPPKWVMRIPPMLPQPHSTVAVKKRLLLLRYDNYLEVWKLGSYALNENGKYIFSKQDSKYSTNTSNSNNNIIETDSSLSTDSKAKVDIKPHTVDLKLEENASKLVSVNTKGNRPLRCCSISPDGQMIAYSTDSAIRMLKLGMDNDDNTSVSLSKMTITGLSARYCDRMVFSQDSRNLLLHSEGTMYSLQVDPDADATIIQTITTDKYLKAPTLLHLHLSACDGVTYLTAADTAGGVAVWVRRSKYKYEHHATLPTYQCLPSALTVYTGDTDVLVVVYVDQKILEYDLKSKKFLEGLSGQLPVEWFSRRSAVSGVSALPALPGREGLMLCDDTSVWIMHTRTQEQNEYSQPLVKKKSNPAEAGNATLRIVPIKYLAGFHWLGPDEAVSVETLPEHIVAQLPDTIARKLPPHI